MASSEQAEQPSDGGQASWENYEESPPLPFPERLPEFPHHHYNRGDSFAVRNNQGFLTNNEGSSASRDDGKACFVASTAFSIFVSICLAFGLYGSENIRLGPNSSMLIKPNHFFVKSIKVVEFDAAKGSVLHGFYRTPALDVRVVWSETHKITLPANTHKEWVYYLNRGSQVDITYSVDSPSSSSLILVIVKGDEGLGKWLEDPSTPITAVSWNIIYGDGSIKKDVSESSAYYIAVGNLSPKVVKVNLNTRIKAFLYNTTESYYNCSLTESQCDFQLFFLDENVAVLTSPGRVPGMLSGYWHVKLSFGPRWATYLIGTGGMISLLLLINYFLNRCRWTQQPRRRDQLGDNGFESNPLLSHETDNHSSGGSSFTSVSEGEDYVEGACAGAAHGGKPVNDEEDSQRLCAICFDCPKDCFFLPCGHCVSCFECAKRILEDSGACPICRRHTKKVRKIVTV